jgi:superfamily II helicase
MASVFYFHNGQTADTIGTLIKVLENLDEHTFRYHCNKDKNDFFNWLSTGLNDAKAAAAIRRAKTRKTMLNKLKQIKNQILIYHLPSKAKSS